MTLRSSLVLTSALLFAAPAAAAPSPWSKASMTEAASYVPAGSSTMVVAAGPGAPVAARTLIEALQASPELELVASTLGPVDELSDAQIVKRAFAQRIDRVAIVRVFPTSDATKAVVTIYARSGQVTSAFTLFPGKTLATNPTPDKVEDGVRRDQLQNVSNQLTDTDAEEEEETGEITYKTNAMLGVTAYGIMSMDHVTFYKNGRSIRDTADFYDAIEEPQRARAFRDQASSAASRRRWGYLSSTAGIIGLSVFGTWALVDAANPDADATTMTALTGASLVAIVGGYYLVSSSDPPEPLTGDEGIHLAKRYNKKHQAQQTTLHLAPTATPSGGGLVFGGSF